MSVGNLDIYNAVRAVPKEAQKPFNNGSFSGTDINPMWRIKALTEQFGVAGFGWWTEDVRYWLEPAEDGTVAAFCSLSLRVRLSDAVSGPIHGIGGNLFVQATKNGKRASDEAFKKAYTDALGIAAKALGVGADIWYEKDPTAKYKTGGEVDSKPPLLCPVCGGIVSGRKGKSPQAVLEACGGICADCYLATKEEANA